MSNSSGIFQVQEILGKKIIGGPLEDLISLKATVTPSDVDYDKRIVRSITLKGRNFVSY